MRVIIVDSLIGNDYTINLCRGLQEVVTDLTLILPQNRKYEPLKNTKVKLWAPSKDSSVNKIRKSIDYIVYLFRLFVFIRLGRKCIVHFQFFRRKSDIYFVRLLRIWGIKVVYTAHNVLPHEKTRFDKFRAKVLYKSAGAIIVHSNFIREKLIKEFPTSAAKIHVVPHGNFDNYLPKKVLTKEEVRSYFGLSLNEKVILYFGYIREYKGLDLLIDAFELVAEKDNNINLIIAGAPINDELKNRYKSKISESKFRERIIYHFNFIPSEKIPVYFEASDIIVLPYKSIDHSGIIHLAYSFSKPVIATDVGDFKEIIEHNKSGVILENNTASCLADAVYDLSLKNNLGKMGKYSKSLSETKYSWKNIANLTTNVYGFLFK
jgi:glycosyltransferase involved in cell wall biosynthesis